MNISWQWLAELVTLNNINLAHFSEKLTLAGFEIDNIITNEQQDTILDISTTANRSDTLNIIGLAKEVSSLLKTKTKWYETQYNIPLWRKSVENDQYFVEQYITSQLYDIEIKESPIWLQKKLAVYNIPSINNLNDIINFITIKWSQHICIYDIQNLPEDIKVKSIRDLTTNKKLSELMYNKANNHNVNTKHIIVQLVQGNNSFSKYIQTHSQYPEHIQNLYKTQSQGRKYNIMDAYNEAIILIVKLCRCTYPKEIVHLSQHSKPKKPIYFNYQKTFEVLGPVKSKTILNQNLTLYQINTIFNQLNFIIHSNIDECYIDISEHRSEDIYREIDLIEEIGRLYGFDQFVDKLPENSGKGTKQITKYKINHIRNICRSMGLHEVIHSSIGSNYPTTIYNPLTREYSSLRYALLPQLIKSSIYNTKQSQQFLDMFELGRVFTQNSGQYFEIIHLAAVLGGNKYIRSQWYEQPQNVSWFQAKGYLEELFERLNLNVTWTNKQNLTWNTDNYILMQLRSSFKNKLCSIVHLNNNNNQIIGIFGELTIGSIYGFEIIINPQILMATNGDTTKFKPYTKYPSIVRDIKIKVPRDWPIHKVLHNLYKIEESSVESIKLFDVYNVKENHDQYKSLGFRITYRNPDSTLTTTEVNHIEEKFKAISLQEEQKQNIF
uniref:phenylalanine--tRNA ligase n=1 Tax=Trichogloeopsis pedicellata TaxID=1495610 RepID=A0A1G4P0S8_9FLOR|nr:Phenylalanine-tRNA ligase beta subunit [Trichogloeopsis pedicellata]SCW24500.1 Phenylalanine-tRNA ligase beta subunit [Trichogloeopsis pedicellata]